ncbi:hypothetical protein C7417_4762 [Cupriavidus plantarum]|nr:hypothetical protein C7417_4762 [Cupriavidus plantarum]
MTECECPPLLVRGATLQKLCRKIRCQIITSSFSYGRRMRIRKTEARILKRTGVLASALAMTGCASGLYQDASGSDTAKLRIKLEPPVVSNLLVASVDVERCQQAAILAWIAGGREDFYEKRVEMLAPLPLGQEGAVEFVIPAGKPMAARQIIHVAKLNFAEVLFALNPAMGNQILDKQPGKCRAPVLVPKAGEQYEITYAVNPGSCTTRIFQLAQSKDGIARTDITDVAQLEVVDKSASEIVCIRPSF